MYRMSQKVVVKVCTSPGRTRDLGLGGRWEMIFPMGQAGKWEVIFSTCRAGPGRQMKGNFSKRPSWAWKIRPVQTSSTQALKFRRKFPFLKIVFVVYEINVDPLRNLIQKFLCGWVYRFRSLRYLCCFIFRLLVAN